MANVESDETYCSEAEKENSNQKRRSLRLSQKPRRSFRPFGNPASQRFDEIYRTLQGGNLSHRWSLHDWEALRVEFEVLKTSVKRVAKSKIAFVEERIKKRMHQVNPTTNLLFRQQLIESQQKKTESSRTEVVQSPNILAGVLTEASNELPLYQPLHNNPNEVLNKQTRQASTSLTQANPIDLTKKTEQQSVIIQTVAPQKPKDSTDIHAKNISINISSKAPQNLVIDLTKDPKNYRKVLSPIVDSIQDKPTTSDCQAPQCIPLALLSTGVPKPNSVPEPSKDHIPDDKPKSFKESLIQLYKENVSLLANEASKHNQNETLKGPKKTKQKKHRLKDITKQRPLGNSEILRRSYGPVELLPPRCVQSEFIPHYSPDSFADDLISLDLTSLDGSNSVASFTSSLKMGFKKIYGTDCLSEVLGCEKIAYSLTEGHVQRLAKVLNLKYDFLKKTIEQVLVDVQPLIEVDGDDKNSNSSIVECSQSPPLRLFPSQRSQPNKKC